MNANALDAKANYYSVRTVKSRPNTTGNFNACQIMFATAAAGVPTDLYLQPVCLGNWSADATISTVPRALEFQAGHSAAEGLQAFSDTRGWYAYTREHQPHVALDGRLARDWGVHIVAVLFVPLQGWELWHRPLAPDR